MELNMDIDPILEGNTVSLHSGPAMTPTIQPEINEYTSEAYIPDNVQDPEPNHDNRTSPLIPNYPNAPNLIPVPPSTPPAPPPRRPRQRFDPRSDPHTSPTPTSPRSQRIQLDARWMDQQVEGLTWVREGLIRENERLMDDLRVIEEGVESGGISEELNGELEKEVGLDQRLKDGLEREIQALRAELDDPVSMNPDLASVSSSSEPTPSIPNQSLYTIIAHLSQKLGDETRHLRVLEDELRELVDQEITARETAEIARRGKQDRLISPRGSSMKPLPDADEETGSNGTEGEEDDDVDADSEEERLALEEKDVLEGPAEMSEVEKSLMDLRGYAEVSLRTWAEESKLPDTVNYLNPLYPVFTLPYVPSRSGRSKRGRTGGSTHPRDLPLALRRIVGRKLRKGTASPAAVEDSRREVDIGRKEAVTEEDEALRDFQAVDEEDDLRMQVDENGMGSSLDQGKHGVDHDQDEQLHDQSTQQTPHVPPQSVFWNPRLPRPRKRGRPSLAAMRMKGGQPTIFESLTMSAHLDPRGMDSMGNAIASGSGSGSAAGAVGQTILIDDIVYPDPPPDVPTWDPTNMEFHTQVPYQIQMARQEMENRLARSYNDVVAAAAEDHRDQHHHQQQQQHGHTDHVGMEGFLSEMVRNSANGGEDRPEEDGGHDDLDRSQVSTLQSLQPDQVGNFSFAELDRHGLFDQHVNSTVQADRADDASQVAIMSTVLGKPIPDGGGLPELACENCGRTGTSVWRKLTVGHDAKKRTYRVCNPCGLHYQKNSVMRPKEMWGNINDAPRKRKYNRRNRDNQTLADAAGPSEPGDEMMMLQ